MGLVHDNRNAVRAWSLFEKVENVIVGGALSHGDDINPTCLHINTYKVEAPQVVSALIGRLICSELARVS
jgi:hypothetical protein